MIQVACSDKYYLPLPPGHRFPMEKYQLVPQQLILEGVCQKGDFFEPLQMDASVIKAIHCNNYISRLNTASLTSQEIRRIGFPYSKAMVEREESICWGTTQAALKALHNGFTFNIAGGTHHAHSAHGEAYCIYNDIAVAAQYLLDKKRAKKILIIDLDVHQGNGTASIFKNNNQVFTFSMHTQKIYPLRKEQSNLDIALPLKTNDKDYQQILEFHIPKLIETQKPDFIFYQAGVDIISSDKLGKLDVSIKGCKNRDYFVFNTARRYGIPVTSSAGGGYSANINEIIEAHCNTYRVAKELIL